MAAAWWVLQFVNENRNLLRIQRSASKLHT